MNKSFYDFKLQDINGQVVSTDRFRGKVLLVVNVASHCGFTPQYRGLEGLYQKYKDKGLVILGFPCNQFGGQEPGTESEILKFCVQDYHVTFPLFSKIEVNGVGAHPFYSYLKAQAPGVFGTEAIKWNFTKFLVDRDGNVLERFAPTMVPESLDESVARIL